MKMMGKALLKPLKVKANNFVLNLFKTRFGIVMNPIPESNENKTPDFEFCPSGNRLFVCEVKEFTDTDEDNTIAPPDGEDHCLGDDNGPARVARKIKEGHDKLKLYDVPKILVLLCNSRWLDDRDLREAFNGYMIYGNEQFSYINEVSKKIAAGNIKEIKWRIDLYVWIDARHKTIDEAKVFFRYPTQTGFELAKKFFGNTKSDDNALRINL